MLTLLLLLLLLWKAGRRPCGAADDPNPDRLHACSHFRPSRIRRTWTAQAPAQPPADGPDSSSLASDAAYQPEEDAEVPLSVVMDTCVVPGIKDQY